MARAWFHSIQYYSEKVYGRKTYCWREAIRSEHRGAGLSVVSHVLVISKRVLLNEVDTAREANVPVGTFIRSDSNAVRRNAGPRWISYFGDSVLTPFSTIPFVCHTSASASSCASHPKNIDEVIVIKRD